MCFACPNPQCSWNSPENLPKDKRWYGLYGFYHSKQNGKIPRYRCRKCHTTFSLRTFSDKWHLRRDSYDIIQIGSKWLAGESIAELSREYGTTPQTIRTRLRRLQACNE